MRNDDTTAKSATPVRTRYEKGWWLCLAATVVCFITSSLNMTTAHRFQPVADTLLLAFFVMSALLGVYSLVFFTKVPKAMGILGLLQACLFGFNILGRFGFAFVIKWMGR